MQTVLILDGQTNQALACARSLGRAGYRILVGSHIRWPLAAWSRYCSARLHAGNETPEAYARLRAQAAELGADWVLPLTERACVLCNLDRDAWEQAGIGVACAPQATLDKAFDKHFTIRIAQQCGISVPATCLPRSLDEARQAASSIGYPLVIKPRFSHAWAGDRFVPNRSCAYVHRPDQLEQQLLSRIEGDDWPLIQAFVGGTGKGVFALCAQGQVIAWFAHERLRDVRPTGSGSSLRRAAPLDPRLREPAQRLLAKLNWHGPAMVEFRDDGTNPWLMEVNGRFWTSLELAIQAGVDFPCLWLATLRNDPVEPVCDYRTDVTLRWAWGDMKRVLYAMAGRPSGFSGPFPTVREALGEVLGRQPTGTRSETWQRDDPWPALAEWVQGGRELISLSGRQS